MYADIGSLCPYFQEFSQEVQQLLLDELFHSHQSPSSMIDSSFICEYDLEAAHGDLFKAPEPIFEEPVVNLDPISAAISMISFADQSVMPTQDLKLEDFEWVQNNENMDFRAPTVVSGIYNEEKQLTNEPAFQKSASTRCLSSSMAPLSGNAERPSYLDFLELDFVEAYGMRRAFSEGDIMTLGNTNVSFIQSPTSVQWPRVTGRSLSFEDRQEKLSRYRIKKLKRNFGRKIKYACRKALADSQPRIRGRFAKTRDTITYQKANDSTKCIDMKE